MIFLCGLFKIPCWIEITVRFQLLHVPMSFFVSHRNSVNVLPLQILSIRWALFICFIKQKVSRPIHFANFITNIHHFSLFIYTPLRQHRHTNSFKNILEIIWFGLIIKNLLENPWNDSFQCKPEVQVNLWLNVDILSKFKDSDLFT